MPALTSQVADSRPDLITYTYNHYLDWTLGAAVAFELSTRRKQAYNAYGEQIRQISYKRDAQNAPVEIVTELAYNALGKLIEKKDPTVSITLANGFQDLAARPTTRWYYDALGRLIGTKDANGNINTSSLLSISPSDQPIIVNEYHADRRLVESVTGSGNYDQAREGVKRSQYDVFGQLRRTANENWDGVAAIAPYATIYGYDANGYLTSIDRPGAADENYEVDSLGNRIATTLAPDAGGTRYRETAQYDALGRILKTTTAFNRSTSYSYEWIATMAGGGGWRRTTFTADGTLIDDTDIFGRIRWHKDLGNHATTYRYNNAGLLSGQTSLAADGPAPNLSQALTTSLVYTGQNISFSYYGNGLLRDTVDNAEARQTWTQYRYDDRGNRTFEGYARNYGTTTSPSWEYFQYSEATYDDANRLVRIWDAKSDISYEYDAVGNRRRVLSKYQDGAQGGLQTQDFWYAYDNMNRFTLTMGVLNSANGNTRGTSASDTTVWIMQGSNGRAIGYDYASQRKVALTANGTESYSYDAEGYLEEVKLNGNRIAWRDNDARGNVMVMEETNGEGVTRHTYTYDADNNVRTDKQEFLKNGESSYKQKAFTENTLMASGALDISVRKEYKDDGSTVNNTVTTDYDYVLWDDAKQSKIGIKATNPGVTRTWEPGSTTLSYDLNGHIERSYDMAGNRYFYYNTDADGRVLRREEVDGPDKKPSKQNRVAAERSALFYQNYYFFNGKEVGTVSNDPSATLKDYSQALLTKSDAYYKRNAVVSADFDQNYQPIGTNYPGRTGSVYTVSRTGETLQNIALALWGDSSLWYLIADANGLTANAQLTQGQRLVVPNKVTNVHNNTQTSRPYDAGQALGDISPTLPDPPPPPKKGCGAMGMIIMIVVAVVVTAITAGALSGATGTLFQLMQAGFQTMAAGITGGLGISSAVGSLGMTGFAVAGAAGSVASQLVGMATGDVQKFSWSSVAISAVGSVVGGKFAGIGGKGWEGAALRAGLGNAATQAVGVATGLQKKFDWRNVAAAAIGGGLTSALTNDGAIKANTVDGFARRVAGGMLTGAARTALNETKPNWEAIAADSFGSALGDAVASLAQRRDVEKVPTISEGEDNALDRANIRMGKPLNMSQISLPLINSNMVLVPSNDPVVNQNLAELEARLNPRPNLDDDELVAANGPAVGWMKARKSARTVDVGGMEFNPRLRMSMDLDVSILGRPMRGTLSERYETSGRGPGTISNGFGDNGGVSYGSYQLASRMGRPAQFLQEEGRPWADRFVDMDPTVRGGEFSDTWRQVARENPESFFAAQHQFIERTHYDVLVERINNQNGVDINALPLAVQDVVWSTAVQHGPGTPVVGRALETMTDVAPNDAEFNERLINAIYDERGRVRENGNLVYFSRSSAAQQAGVAARFERERNDALQMLRNQGRN